MRHIRNYSKVRSAINDHYNHLILKAKDQLAELERKHSGEQGMIDDLKERLAPPKELRNGKTRYPKGSFYTWWHEARERLDAADRAGVVREITFKIEWKKSRMWGMCPSCETWVQYDGEPQDVMKDHETGKPVTDSKGEPYRMATHYNPRTYASGCGYDKRSTVMSEGIQCPAIDRLVIEHEKCWDCYAVEDRDCLPHLSFGGKGAETLRALFVAYGEKPPIPGFEWSWDEGKTWDSIHITKKRRWK